MIEFRVLGPLEVVRDDHPVALGPPKQRELLAALLVLRRQPVSSDRLIDALWGERPPASAAKIVQGYVSNLRKALGDGVLVTRGRGYLLQVDPDWIDVDRFESLASAGQGQLAEGDSRAAAQLLRKALDLWRGPPLAEFGYESFAQPEIARLEELRLSVLEDRVEADLALGRHAQLVGELEALSHQHPLRERFTGQLMLALYRSGRQAEALETYRNARARLVGELGLEPGRELQALEQQILAQDPALDLSARRNRPEVATVGGRNKPGPLMIAGGGAVLLAAIVAIALSLAGSGASTVRVAPNSVAAIDVRNNHVVGAAVVGAAPGPIAFGSGSLWVGNVDDQTVSRVNPHTLQGQQAIPVSGPPNGIASAGGSVWVVGSGPIAAFVPVDQIDAQYGTLKQVARVPDVVPGSQGAVAARGSSLWVAPSSGELTALDPATGRTVRRIDPNGAPEAIAVGGDGAVWVADNDAGNVIRVDPTGVLDSVPVDDPSGIAVGARAVWVAETDDDKVVRIDPTTRSVTATIPVGEMPTGVAVGAGSVWVANSGDGTVTRINPATDKPITTITVGGSPQQITVAGGRAWVTVDAQTIPVGRATAGAGTLRVDAPYDFGPVDPAVVGDPRAQTLLYATCAHLLNYPDKPGAAGAQLMPEVAQSLPTPSADGKSYTFTIRRGFRFSPPSNQPVTAQTFKYSIQRSLNPKMHDYVGSDFRDIVGASAYMAGKSPDISGVVARGNKLTIRLTAPDPDILARTAMPEFCAVPTGTPIVPGGLRTIPSAGPYQIAEYTPRQGIVLTRNPNYHGNRPHRLARIVIRFGVSAQRAIAQVEAGTADYAFGYGWNRAQAASLTARYGPGSRAARQGHQQLFVSQGPQLDLFSLNTHRPLFSDARLRRAVNYAINRKELARLGDAFQPAPEHPTSLYLPPGLPGYRNVQAYPLTPDLAKARRLASGHRGATVVLYTCDIYPCPEQAEIVKRNLAAIGLRVEVREFDTGTLFPKLVKPGEPYDMGWIGWIPDYLDPGAMLNELLEQPGYALPSFVDPTWRARLAAASRVTGPERYLNYARLDAELARNAAPLVAFGYLPGIDFYSARIGCQVDGLANGTDLAALCIKHPRS